MSKRYRCPRDGQRIELTGRPTKPPVYCLRGGSCGIAACPLSWSPARPPREIIRARSEAAEAARKREALREAGALKVSAWRKRREKIARRKAEEAARKAAREARPAAYRPPEPKPPEDRPLDTAAVLARVFGGAL